MKISVIGYSGSGKSTLAEYLGERFHAKVLHLDCVHWLPGWVENRWEDEKVIVDDFLDTHSSWVIDGNYSKSSFKRRMEESDRIVFLDFDRAACLYRAVKRFVKYRGKSRNSMTEGCAEKIDLEFIWWILYKGRTKKRTSKYREVLHTYSRKTVVIRNQRQLTAYMRNAGQSVGQDGD